jgi:hypothetical protein
VLSLRSVKCSLHAPRYQLRRGHHSAFCTLVSHSTPPSTCTSAHNQCYSSTHQHSRTNPTPHTSPSVVPLPSLRTIQIQHTTAVRRGAAHAGTGTRCGVQLASAPRGAQDVRMPTVSWSPCPRPRVRVRPSGIRCACPASGIRCACPASGIRCACPASTRPVSGVRVQWTVSSVRACGVRCMSSAGVQRPADGVRFRWSVSGIRASRVNIARTGEFVERVGAAGRPRWVQRVRRAVAVRGRGGRLPAWGLMGRAGAALALPGSREGRRQPRAPLGRRPGCAPPRCRVDQGRWSRPGCRPVGWGA